MKKNTIMSILISILLIASFGCSKDSSNPVTDNSMKAYELSQFYPLENVIPLISHSSVEDNVDYRNLFAINISAADGFSPRNRGYKDLPWSDFTAGYYIPELEQKTYFEDLTAQGIKAYNVKTATNFELYRAFKLVKPDQSIAVCELSGYNSVQIENYEGNQENSIKLSDIIPTSEITQLDSVQFIAVDGYHKTYSPDEFNDCYWLLNSQKTMFPNTDLDGSKKKFKYLEKVIVYGTQVSVEEPFVCNFSDTHDANFTIPENLDSYNSIDWTIGK
jgi:hypothetical protein